LDIWRSRCRFFFSSRRRHTRCLSDWSSDVCSSDLFRIGSLVEQSQQLFDVGRNPTEPAFLVTSQFQVRPTLFDLVAGLADLTARSEERRVGKECEIRWSLFSENNSL